MSESHVTNDSFAILEKLAERLRVVDSEMLELDQAVGRVLRADVVADRNSPAADVSAMDGYAILLEDGYPDNILRIVGQSVPGQSPPLAPALGQAIQIFTGAVVPSGCGLVVKREDTVEPASGAEPLLKLLPQTFREGMNIRRQGENALAETTVLQPCQLMDGPRLAVAANFGAGQIRVSRPLRVHLVVTGDEVLGVHDVVQPWQLRDSNGPTLAGILNATWLTVHRHRSSDSLESLTSLLARLWDQADAVLLTGGVSMGDFDYVPQAVVNAGGETVFHKLPIRPGKPIYGAVGPQGQLILGLPGNPVSAAVCAARFGLPLLRKAAGFHRWQPRVSVAKLANPDEKTLGLTWFRLVRELPSGDVELIVSQGSGDLVSLGLSDGFIEIAPQQQGAGPWPYYRW